MFTGIIETVGIIEDIQQELGNVHLRIASSMSSALHIDQSVAHNGACLTVTEIAEQAHTVTAIEETLRCTTIGNWKVGTKVNLERAMKANARLDGHFVQGHVDGIGTCVKCESDQGSWMFTFQHDPKQAALLVDKGSITVNGVSLTVVNPTDETFSVAIIPYTYSHTIFNQIQAGTRVHLEYDIIGKYLAKMAKHYILSNLVP